MKMKKLVVIVSNRLGNCYQVALSEDQANLVREFISELHNNDGVITVMKPKLSMVIENKK